ncbi:MAG: hypothetical protein II106_00540, partial [Oscillospiraceae bacterium]|nr:hypothetical protein [Oscillospiraceae bacterium]
MRKYTSVVVVDDDMISRGYMKMFIKLEFPQMNIETAKISTAERRFGMQAGIHGRRKSPQTKKRTKYQTCAEQ